MDRINRNFFTYPIAPGGSNVSDGSAYMLPAPVPTTPCPISWNGQLAMFWTSPLLANSGRLGIACSRMEDQGTWRKTDTLGTRYEPAKGTSPSALIFQNYMWIFFNAAGSGLCYVRAKPMGDVWPNWSADVAMSTLPHGQGGDFTDIAAGTSPSAVLHDGLLYVFWATQSGVVKFSIGTPDSSAINGVAWGSPGIAGPPGLKVSANTSPAVVEFQDNIYLFHSGVAGDGIWYSTLKKPGSAWTDTVCVPDFISPPGDINLPGTSPGVFVWNTMLNLVWVAKSDGNPIHVTSTSDGTQWKSPVA